MAAVVRAYRRAMCACGLGGNLARPFASASMAEVQDPGMPVTGSESSTLYDFGKEPVQEVLAATFSGWDNTLQAVQEDAAAIRFDSKGDWDVYIKRAAVAGSMPGQSGAAGFATQAEFMRAARGRNWSKDVPEEQPQIYSWDDVLACVELETCVADECGDDIGDDQLSAMAARVCGGVRQVLQMQQTYVDGNSYEAYALVELGNGVHAHYALIYCTG